MNAWIAWGRRARAAGAAALGLGLLWAAVLPARAAEVVVGQVAPL